MSMGYFNHENKKSEMAPMFCIWLTRKNDDRFDVEQGWLWKEVDEFS